MIAGALWVGLILAAASEPVAGPLPPPVAAPSSVPSAPPPASFVAVVRPPPDDPLLSAASARLRSELAASGLDGQAVDCQPIGPAARVTCPLPGATAAIALAREGGVAAIDVRLRLPDGLELGRQVRVPAGEGGNDPTVLAVRAVEMLHALRLNAARPRPAPARPPAMDAEVPPAPALPPPPPRWGLAAGLAGLGGPPTNQPGFGPGLGLTLEGRALLGPHLAVTLTAAGPFNASFGPDQMGRQATLVQALAMLGLRYRIATGLLRPFGVAKAGVDYMRATVTDALDGQFITSELVPLVGAGGGLAIVKGPFVADVEADAFLTAPDVLVELSGQIVGRLGAPSILLSADVGVTFR